MLWLRDDKAGGGGLSAGLAGVVLTQALQLVGMFQVCPIVLLMEQHGCVAHFETYCACFSVCSAPSCRNRKLNDSGRTGESVHTSADRGC